MHPRGLLVGAFVCALAGCPGRPNAPVPAEPTVMPMPPVAPVGWWTAGDAACPALDTGAPAPGGPPGATLHAGQVAGGPEVGAVQCLAAGVPHGPSTRFHAGGVPAESGLLDRGRQSGTWTTWHANGAVASYGVYMGGVPDGAWSTWYPSGTPRDRGEYRERRRTGLWVTWKDRHVHPARFTEYDRRGKVKMTGGYRDGSPRETLAVCMVGMAYPGCRSLPLLDITGGVGYGAETGESEGDGDRSVGSLQLGWLYNLDEEHGVGASFGWLFDAGYPATMLDLRYRYWLGEYVAVEGSLGLIFPRSDHPGEGTGVRLQSGIVLADAISLVAAVERQPAGGGGSDFIVLSGLRIGAPVILTALYATLEVAGSIK